MQQLQGVSSWSEPLSFLIMRAALLLTVSLLTLFLGCFLQMRCGVLKESRIWDHLVDPSYDCVKGEAQLDVTLHHCVGSQYSEKSHH